MYRFAFLMLLLFVAPDFAVAQGADEKVFERKSLKSIQKSIKKLADNGYIPTDVATVKQGRKVMFSVRMAKPQQAFKWFAEFEMDDDEFKEQNEKHQQEKCFLVAHEQYEDRKGQRHACIWHFDNARQFHSREATQSAKDRPAAIPIGTVWDVGDQIPTDGEIHPVCTEIDNQALGFMRTNDMPAMSVVVMLGGELVFQKAYGFADFDQKRKLKVDHAFRVGRISDLITCIATLQLIDNGKLKLDQPVFEILETKPWKPSLMDPQLKKITVRHLLQSSGGFDPKSSFEPGFKSGKIKEEMKLSDQPTPTQLIEYGMSQRLAFPPGNGQKESRFGIFLLGRVIEEVTGQSYPQFVTSNIAEPLGMTSLRMMPTNPDKKASLDVTHINRQGTYFRQLVGKRAGDWVRHHQGAIDFRLLDTTDGWMATPLDVVKLVRSIDPVGNNPILSQKAKALLFAKPESITATATTGGPVWQAMGMEVQSVRKNNLLRYGKKYAEMGASGGFNNFPGGITYCYLFNTAKTVADEAPSKFESVMYKECFRIKNSFANKKKR